MIDVETGVGQPGPPTDCLRPAVLFPNLDGGFLRHAMFYIHALEVNVPFELYRVGDDDDGIDWAAADPVDVCGTADEATGEEYRALASESPGACGLLDNAEDMRDSFLGNPQDPFFRDAYEWWMDRVKEAHAFRVEYR